MLIDARLWYRCRQVGFHAGTQRNLSDFSHMQVYIAYLPCQVFQSHSFTDVRLADQCECMLVHEAQLLALLVYLTLFTTIIQTEPFGCNMARSQG